MSKRMLAVATSLMMAAPLLAVPGFAQAPATQAPAAPAPATQAPATPAPSSSAPAPSGSMPMHHAGQTGAMHAGTHTDHVTKLQTALNNNGATLTVDGKMGPKTTAALKTYQQAHNLKVTGRPDKETRDALMKPAS
jgi:peptidoglycan DL-endopeptidase CwlO